MRRIATLVFVIMAVAMLMGGPAVAQTGELTIETFDDDDYPYVGVTVTVPETLSDARLPKEAFAITENGERRPLPLQGNTTRQEQVAPRVVLLIDVSGSMMPAIGRARDAADAFVRSLPSGSEVAVVTFGDDVDVREDFTTDTQSVRGAIAAIDVVNPRVTTALYDGVRRAAELLPVSADVPSSIVLLSDGGDDGSDSTRQQAVTHLEDSDATLWAVALAGLEQNPEALAALAGDDERVLQAENADELYAIYRDLASDLSRRYLLIYESAASGPTDIGVIVNHGDTRAQATTQVELSGRATTGGAAPVASPDIFTVRLPLLATTPAYVAGITATALGTLLIWLVVLGPRATRTRARLMPDVSDRARPRMSLLAEKATDLADRSLRDRKLGRRIDRKLEAAGLDLRPGELVVIVVALMFVTFAGGVLASGPLLGLLLVLTTPLITRLVLSIRRDRRHAAFAEQLPDVLQLLAGSLRAGYGLLQGIDAIARDIEEPGASELRRILIENRLGRDLNDAMASCAERMDNDDFSWVVQAIGIHRDIGGDLARVLDNIITTVRDRGDVQREVRALSAEGRLSANVLTGLPILVLIGLQFLNPAYLSEMLAQPVGWLMLGVAGVSLATGALVIRRMVKIRY